MRVHGSGPSDDADVTRPALPGHGAGNRKKAATSVRAWLLLDAGGQTQVMEAGKHAIMRRTGLPARDLRVLDPILSYPSKVMVREKATVINLEHIKAIITAHEVLLLNSRDPSVTPFVEELRRRIVRHHHQATNKFQDGSGDEDSKWTQLYDSEEARSRSVSPENAGMAFTWTTQDQDEEESKAQQGKQDFHNTNAIKILPFEFVALEACLEDACVVLENEAKTLEQEAHPALDKLTSMISTLNLERVRQIKSRLVAITGRVQKVRDELEQLLDDDEDMAEMYLTDKLLVQQHDLEYSSASSFNDGDDDMDDQVLQPQTDDSNRMPPEISLETGRDSRGTHTGTTYSAETKHVDVHELEMLLEAYFVQIDGTLNKLSTLREYVDDTEDYINIMLDDKQNQLLQIGVMLSLATLAVNAFIVVVGILGMNIRIPLFNDRVGGMTHFLWTLASTSAATIFFYVLSIAWCKHKRLLT